ncbi:TIGR03032 family protein [Desulfoluna limicola]|uniref:TIGR03032 family protein n=1 Tax=Desulfoluna limicola TaxID=2810562 RepID=A0ABM7PDH4_9BACT|nr:TIGR03032 family protein [Desulfoluna limicola]BCS95690.1 TIGR03032 family protein [Desulfoluna limicola]
MNDLTEDNTIPRQNKDSARTGLSFSWSDGFPEWFRSQAFSLAFTACRTNRLFLLGSKPNGRLSLFDRRFERPLGLHVDGEGRLFMATRDQIWRLDNILGPGPGDCDRLYVPRRCWTTGHLNTHDLALDANGQLLFVNTLFSCLSGLSHTHSFQPVWKPPFISALLPEDRCHLNGMAMDCGIPRYVTLRNQSDAPHGWREDQAKGGCLMDVRTGKPILTDLCVPHSPRIHGNQLWLLNSGTGELGVVDIRRQRFIPVCSFPGYLRGLAFFNHIAVVGVSKARDGCDFDGLPLGASLNAHAGEAICALCFVDITSGRIQHSLRFHGAVSELYDVQVLPGVSCPMALGFQSDEIQTRVTIDPVGARLARKECA